MAEKLIEYNKKRNFEKTLEPEGKKESKQEGLRYVIQHHIARKDHYDFRLEWKGALLSWAVPKGPSFNPRDKRLAIMVEDHPIEYRNFEGTIPKGEYGGGVVMLWDEGEWEPYQDVDEGLKEGSLKFILKGKRLQGKWALVRIKSKDNDPKDNWILLKDKDEYAQSDDGISDFDTSIRSGRTMTEIEKGDKKKLTNNPFSKIEVQLAKSLSKPPDDTGWLFEPKYDGYRIIAYVAENKVSLISRNGMDYTNHFKEVANSLVQFSMGRAMIFDGEMTVIDSSGKTDFQALQNYIKKNKSSNLTYIIFDLLALDGEDLRSKQLNERKNLLETLLKGCPNNLYYSQHVEGQGKESFFAACNIGLEGIIGKKADSIYKGGRTSDWIKVKCDNRQEFVIAGYTLSDKKSDGVSSLLLGVYENGDLIYVGRAGTGLRETAVKELEKKFESIKKEKSPFKAVPKPKSNEVIFWIEPKLVAEIKFAEWTKENLLRQASFKGLRQDKNPKEVIREKSDEEIHLQINDKQEKEDMEQKAKSLMEKIKITSPDKIIYTEPELTKADVILYYAKVAEYMLPYLSHRVLSIIRCPKGISGECFFKKHPGAGNKEIRVIPISEDKEKEDYFYIENEIGLITEAQMGTVEFHIWGSRVEELEKPDIMVFDLDPDEDMDLNTVRRGVKDLKSVLDDLSLKSFLKTSGGKGYHVVVPFTPSVNWEVFYDFAKRVAQVMEEKWPERFTSNSRKAKRAGKIFIDWMRNGRGATSVAPYSLRARKGAGVSMPIFWEELFEIAPDDINILNAFNRIDKDPWKDFFNCNQQLK